MGEECDYDELNEEFYTPKKVGYSWFGQNIAVIQDWVEASGFETESISCSEWRDIPFIRDGSFMVLEDTLVVKSGEKTAAFITPKKALVIDERLDDVLEAYPFPISLREIIYMAFLLLLNVVYLAGVKL